MTDAGLGRRDLGSRPVCVGFADESNRRQRKAKSRRGNLRKQKRAGTEAIRRLVELGLRVKTEEKPVRRPGRRLRARELATEAIEKISDPSAPPEERAQRRRRLTKGPSEFREARVDQPKAKGK
jgi:hypothetical protein